MGSGEAPVHPWSAISAFRCGDRSAVFTNPTSCGPALWTRLATAPHLVAGTRRGRGAEPAGHVRCRLGRSSAVTALLMAPSLTAEVTSDDSAFAPTGFDLDTKVPQTYDNARDLATPDAEAGRCDAAGRDDGQPFLRRGPRPCSEAQYAEEGAAEKSTGKEEGKGCPNNVQARHRQDQNAGDR